MTDYISREAAKEKCCSLCRWEGTSNCDECEHPIDDIPAADVRPVVRGRWKRGAYTDVAPNDIAFYYCSECGHRLQTYRTRYCPNCGADMRNADD